MTLLLSIFKNIVARFATVGILATATHSSVYLIAVTGFNLAPQLSNLIGFCCAFMVSYCLQSRWTFNSRESLRNGKTLLLFFLCSLGGMLLNALIVFVTTRLFGLEPYFALLGMVGVTPVFSFLVMNKWVFPKT